MALKSIWEREKVWRTESCDEEDGKCEGEGGRRGKEYNLTIKQDWRYFTFSNIYAFCGFFLYSVDASIKHIYCAGGHNK